MAKVKAKEITKPEENGRTISLSDGSIIKYRSKGDGWVFLDAYRPCGCTGSTYTKENADRILDKWLIS